MTTISAPQALPSDSLACLACGVAVQPAPYVATFTSIGRVIAHPLLGHVSEDSDFEFEMTRCAECEAINERAAALLAEYPAAATRLGWGAVHRVECALSGLDLLDARAPRVASARAVLLLVEHLTTPGGLARWVARFAPITQLGAQDETCNSQRWGHASEEDRQAVRDGLAALLRAVTEQPVPIPCPDPSGGCMFCGVASIDALPSRAHLAWSVLTANPGLLGGRLSPVPITGHLCAPCRSACDEVGSIGPTAMERALLRHLGASRRATHMMELDGLTAWAVMPDAQPNPGPWDHLGDSQELIGRLGS